MCLTFVGFSSTYLCAQRFFFSFLFFFGLYSFIVLRNQSEIILSRRGGPENAMALEP